MSILNTRREENIIKKKLLYDGNGTGDDKRLLSLIRSITKFCLVEEPADQIEKAHAQINKLLAQSSQAADKNERILEVCKNVSTLYPYVNHAVI